MPDEREKDEYQIRDPQSAIRNVWWRDEILQVMYWMTGEGLGSEFAASDLQKFLQQDMGALAEHLGRMVADGLLERVGGDKFALTAQGKKEGGRRFADEFEEMLKPGHFECDEPDCDCHNADSIAEACKHLSPAQTSQLPS